MDEKPLPKRKVGGQRKPGGRVRFTTTLPPKAIAELQELGDGNVSAGIVMLLEWWKDKQRFRAA